MARQVVLLRGVNLGPRNRIAMADLRTLLAGAGFGEVRTYLQSGNVVLESNEPADSVAAACRRLIAEELGLELELVARTRDELARVVELDPLGEVAVNPKRYQVSFLAGEPDPDAVARLPSLAVAPEQVVVAGREIYAWHPEGIARSRLWTFLAGKALGVTATARNWTTVTRLLALADE